MLQADAKPPLTPQDAPPPDALCLTPLRLRASHIGLYRSALPPLSHTAFHPFQNLLGLVPSLSQHDVVDPSERADAINRGLGGEDCRMYRGLRSPDSEKAASQQAAADASAQTAADVKAASAASAQATKDVKVAAEALTKAEGNPFDNGAAGAAAAAKATAQAATAVEAKAKAKVAAGPTVSERTQVTP